MLPPRCPACREIVESDGNFCAACWTGLEFITAPMCACCGTPFEVDRGANARCGACLDAPPRYAAARAAMVYGGPARKILLGFKHGDRQHLVKVMAPQLVRAGGDWLGTGALLVPVPLHRWRLWKRGFNQAALLAQSAGRRSGTQVSVDALSRVRATMTSRGMGRRKRAANVRAAFRVAHPDRIRGRDVVLVDDVLTTGATAEACTRMLLRAGAKSVRVLTWARVVREVA
ncbi:ComF family protein [Polymorphobacter sp. PAMC 29334]|uniref:ComF family protein n=1 Tax=Polymorphobacter sp. PAMC 29334 TaxID=2862331 RepID=UPI00351D401B